MKFEVRNWTVNVEKRKYSRDGSTYYAGWLDFEGKSGRCGTGWTGNQFILYQEGRIAYDWPETVPRYLENSILRKCQF